MPSGRVHPWSAHFFSIQQKGLFMGLYMFLTGERHFHTREASKPPLTSECYSFGSWYRHHRLHSYIAVTCGDDIDHHNDIHLDLYDLQKIRDAIRLDELPIADAKAFASDVAGRDRDVGVFDDAIRWFVADDDEAWRTVIYHAMP